MCACNLFLCSSTLQALCLIGEFNSWKPRDTDWAVRNPFGTWELFLADKEDGTPAIKHRCVWNSGYRRVEK